MSKFDDLVRDFMRDIGMAASEVEEDTRLVLRFEEGARLFIEPRAEEALVYLECSQEFADLATCEWALRACDLKRRLALPVRATLGRDDHLILAITLADSQLTTQALHQAVGLLQDMQRRMPR